jgi:mannosyl-oligosaccharide glucosidase
LLLDAILQNLVTHARAALAPYQDPSTGPPEPSFTLQLNDEVLSSSNLYAVQKTFDGAFSFDVFFDSASSDKTLDGKHFRFAHSSIAHDISAAALDHGLQVLTQTYNDKFEKMYPVPADLDVDGRLPALKQFSKDITANILGGVGYFFGTSLVDKGFAREWDQEEDAESADDEDATTDKKESGAKLTEPRALLTATPSRSFFPRGFYWYVANL